MRITSSQYAKALYELTLESDNAGVDLAVKNMLRVLQKNGQMKLKKEIIKKFNEISNFKKGIIAAEVYSREKLGDELIDSLNNYIEKRYSAKKVMIENKVDEKIKGGLIIRVGDEVIDGSVARNIKNLKNFLEK